MLLKSVSEIIEVKSAILIEYDEDEGRFRVSRNTGQSCGIVFVGEQYNYRVYGVSAKEAMQYYNALWVDGRVELPYEIVSHNRKLTNLVLTRAIERDEIKIERYEAGIFSVLDRLGNERTEKSLEEGWL